MRRSGPILRRTVRSDGRSAAPAVGTILLVVITVAMISVVGMYVFTLVRVPDEPPEMKVNFSQLNDRWTISITRSRDDVPLEQLKVLVRDPNGEFASYDSDGDGVVDAVMVTELDQLVVSSGDGPQLTPLVLVDADGDSALSVGDSLVVYEVFFFPVGPLMDADRGYALVGPNPDGIPRNSTLQLLASHITLGSTDIHPGDVVQVEIKMGVTVIETVSGTASSSGTYMEDVHVGAGWATGAYNAVFTIRPGELDEWSSTYSFQVDAEAPLTPAEEAQYFDLTHPFRVEDVVTMVHKPSNSVVLEFRL